MVLPYRKYTGLHRTPASMAWLIRERARLQGRIEKIRKEMETRAADLVRLETRLCSLDDVFQLHEVVVEPKSIAGTRTKRAPLAPYGVMRRYLLASLRDAPR